MNTVKTIMPGGFAPSLPSVCQGPLILVNSSRPLAEEISPRQKLIPVRNSFPDVLMDIRASSCLRQLLAKAQSRCRHFGEEIVPVSGYRSFGEQKTLYTDSLAENGRRFTSKYVAKAGCSEHHTGLAIDLALKSDSIDPICPDFPDTGLCGEFRRQAPSFGFVQRYTAQKEHITKIACEPWHFRYVGYPHSELMVQMDFCLEEYIGYLRNFRQDSPLCLRRSSKNISIFFVPEEEADTVFRQFDSPARSITEISGNNEDGFVMTVWA